MPKSYTYHLNLPYGETFVDQHLTNSGYQNVYKFNGKELDAETGLYYYGARYYNPRISQFYGVDPLASERTWLSPYNYVQNNPLSRIDNDGQLDNPIYDTDGNFLGTDDKGLQGEAIIMDKSNFKQSMSHKEAEKYNLGMGYFKHDVAAKQKVENHFSKLPERPDYDGKLTFKEAIKWYNTGNGKPLYVNISKIDFKSSDLLVSDFNGKSTLLVNFFNLDTNKKALHRVASLDVGGVYGTLTLKLLNSNGDIDLVRNSKDGSIDKFDFNNRKFQKIADYLYPGKGTDFEIFGYNKGKIWKNIEERNKYLLKN